jgi:hypothetical protein
MRAGQAPVYKTSAARICDKRGDLTKIAEMVRRELATSAPGISAKFEAFRPGIVPFLDTSESNNGSFGPEPSCGEP